MCSLSTLKVKKVLLREIKENLNKQRKIPCSHTGRLKTGNVNTPQIDYGFNAIPVKNQAGYFQKSTSFF